MWKPPPPEVEDDEGGEHDEGEGGLDTIREPEEDEDMMEAEREAQEASEDKKMFDALNGGNPISVTQAATLARQLGMSPSFADMEAFQKKNGDQLDWSMFSKFRNQLMHPDDTLDTFVAAFAYFDPSNNGTLSTRQMRNILATFGEPLNEEEANLVLSQFCGPDGNVDYQLFCEKILARE